MVYIIFDERPLSFVTSCFCFVYKANLTARKKDVDTSAVNYLHAKLYLREVFLQGMPFIQMACPRHPVFNTPIFHDHAVSWRRWSATVLEFHEKMENIKSDYLCPRFPMMVGPDGLQMQTVLRWIKEGAENVIGSHGFLMQVTSLKLTKLQPNMWVFYGKFSHLI